VGGKKLDSQKRTFDRLYNDYSDKVYSLARFKGLGEDASLDIVQETFLALFSSYHSFNEKSSVKTFIVSIARHKIADYYRKKYLHNEDELDCNLEVSMGTDEIVEGLDVKKSIEQLDIDDREMLHLIFTQGLSYKEVATILDVPEGTIKSRMFNVRKKLKSSLGGDYR
jgi:RNA polymerase sigma-70 factor (ECF subfamily)